MKRPSPIRHMLNWGMLVGLLIALSYMTLILDFFSGDDLFSLDIRSSLLSLVFAFILGSIPGAGVGYFLGLNMNNSLFNARIPITTADMKSKRLAVYGWSFVLTLFAFVTGFFYFNDLSDFIFLGVSAFIAAIIATYAAHRYMYRLHLWSASLDTRKSKRKNDAYSRLTESHADNLPDDYQPDHQAQSEINS